jgi:hypothetical protein
MNAIGKSISRGGIARAMALTAAIAAAAATSVLQAGTALAASQPLVPARCLAQVGVDHVVFGPDSFFEPSTVQGPTSFRETPARRS